VADIAEVPTPAMSCDRRWFTIVLAAPSRSAPVEDRGERGEDGEQGDGPQDRRQHRVLHRPRVDRGRRIRVAEQFAAGGGWRAPSAPS
jgi:hypothetical protein